MKNQFAFPTLFALLFIFLSPYADAAQIKLAWDPPTTNADGTPLTDLLGYKIYWGTSSGTYENSADVGNVTNCVLSDLIEGQTYFIAVIAYDSFVPPDESDYSNEVTGVAINAVIDCSSLGITPQNAIFPYSGGAGNISVTATDGSCKRVITGSPSWVNITSGSSGQGSGMIEYTVARNNTQVARKGLIDVLGNILSIYQEAYPGSIFVEPDTLDFGTQQNGKMAELRMKISNIGSTPLEINSMEIAGNTQTAFWASSDCTAIATGSSCNAVVAFTPNSSGAESASLVIKSNDWIWPAYNVTLSGVGSDTASPSISASPDVINIPYVDIEMGDTQTIHIRNTGTGSLIINSISVEGQDASEFVVNSNCTVIESGGSCNFSLSGRYSSQKAKQISVVIASNAINTPKLEIPVTMSSGQCTGEEINLSQTSQTVSSSGANGRVEVTSTGSGWCALYAISRSPWISVSAYGGSVNYSIAANASGTLRMGTISIAGQPFTIIQNSDGSNTIFGDMAHDVFGDYINAIYATGITVGCGQEGNVISYCPLDYVTRGQMAAFIVRSIYGEAFIYRQTPYFVDVPSSHIFFAYVQKIKDMSITVVNDIYGVDDYVTRGQMAAFIIRAIYGETFNYSQTPYFTDVRDTNNFFKYVQKVKDTGITVVSDRYRVDDYVTREEMAAFLARAFLGMK